MEKVKKLLVQRTSKLPDSVRRGVTSGLPPDRYLTTAKTGRTPSPTQPSAKSEHIESML